MNILFIFFKGGFDCFFFFAWFCLWSAI